MIFCLFGLFWCEKKVTGFVYPGRARFRAHLALSGSGKQKIVANCLSAWIFAESKFLWTLKTNPGPGPTWYRLCVMVCVRVCVCVCPWLLLSWLSSLQVLIPPTHYTLTCWPFSSLGPYLSCSLAQLCTVVTTIWTYDTLSGWRGGGNGLIN
jgi:hypothetical protein